MGVGVIDTSAYPEFFDLLTVYRGKIRLVEIKDGAKIPSKRKLTLAQEDLHRLVQWHGAKVHVVKTLEEAMAAHLD